MSAQDPTKTSPFPVAAGLGVAAALLYVLALLAQLALRVITQGVLTLGLGLLAFCILFYVVGTFVAFGTHQRPEHPSFVVKNVAVQAGFLAAGWLLCLRGLPLVWLALSIAFTLVLHGGAYGFAALRTLGTRSLAEQPAVSQPDALERYFDTRSHTYLALPIGAALGTIAGSLAGASTPGIVRHGLAGVFVAIALSALAHLVAGARALAGDFIRAHGQGRVAVKVSALKRAYQLELAIPATTSADLALEAAGIVAAIRRALLLNQLQPVLLFVMASLALWQLELPALPASRLACALLAPSLLLTQLAYAWGQRRSQQRLLATLREPQPEAQARVRSAAAVLAAPATWAASLGAVALGGLAYQCIASVLAGLAR